MEFARALVTLSEMLESRGYDADTLAAKDDLTRKYGEGSAFSVRVPPRPPAPSGSAGPSGAEPRAPMRLVFYPQPVGLNTKDVRKALDGDEHRECDYLLVIHARDKPSPNVAKAALEVQDKLTEHGRYMQVFTFAQLQFNVMRHELQPKFERLSAAEVAKVVADHSLDHVLQLPRINRDDKVACYMGLRPGDVVRITRKSPGCGESVNYRVCVGS